jgi:hypothetical protein
MQHICNSLQEIGIFQGLTQDVHSIVQPKRELLRHIVFANVNHVAPRQENIKHMVIQA